LIGKLERERPIKRVRSRGKDSIEMDFKETG
jgi:hypothetical protein